MRKLISILLAISMIIAIGATVVAEPSPAHKPTQNTGLKPAKTAPLIHDSHNKQPKASPSPQVFPVEIERPAIANTANVVVFNTLGGSTVNPQLVENGGLVSKPANPIRPGFVFVGWLYVVGDYSYMFDFDEMKVYYSFMLYATWANEFTTLVFDTQGGSEIADQIVYYDSEPVKPDDPVKSGYKFMGWFVTLPDGSEVEIDFVNMTVNGDWTLVAKWAPAEAPARTARPKHTAAPKPTATPKPTVKPKTSPTPRPAVTPKPSPAPKPSPTPKASVPPKPSTTPKASVPPKPSPTPKASVPPKPNPSATPKHGGAPGAPGVSGIAPSASVKKQNGNTNMLTISLDILYTDGTRKTASETFEIKNNSAGTYDVAGYKVYVDTKGNDQIRACYIVNSNA